MTKASKIYHASVRDERYAQGIQALSALIAEGVETATALQLRANLHVLVGDRGRAIQDLDQAIRLSPEQRGLYHDRGSLHRADGESRLALADLCEAAVLAHEAGDDDLIDAVEHHVLAVLEEMRNN